ncbi:MAG: hypothetical protein JWR69_1345 [Pedosphaera sp.]|nr:hypothetical protein [Pedosphaera sp.]
MSAIQVIEEIKKLTADEQKEVFVFLVEKLMAKEEPHPERWEGKKLSFDEACEVVFRENRELLSLLA